MMSHGWRLFVVQELGFKSPGKFPIRNPQDAVEVGELVRNEFHLDIHGCCFPDERCSIDVRAYWWWVGAVSHANHCNARLDRDINNNKLGTIPVGALAMLSNLKKLYVWLSIMAPFLFFTCCIAHEPGRL